MTNLGFTSTKYTPDQVWNAVKDSIGQGFSLDEARTGAFNNFGLSNSDFDAAVLPRLKTAANESVGQGFTMDQTRTGALNNYRVSNDYFDRAMAYEEPSAAAPRPTTPPPMMPPPMMSAPAPFTPPPAPVLDTSYKENPYLDAADQAITNRVNDNLNRYMLPQVRSGAMAAGQYGGSRQGVVEANAFNDANRNISDAIAANRYGDYNNAMNRNLAKYQADQGYSLGIGNLALGNKQADNAYALGQGNLGLGYLNSDRQYDLGMRSNALANDTLNWNIDTGNYNRAVNNLGLGVGLINQGIAWQNQANQVGNTVQNAPLNYWSTFLNAGNQTGGLGGSSSQQMPGNPFLGALGGFQLGSAFTKPFGG